MANVKIRGNEIEIDEECVDLVKYFNSVGLDTKFCCSGHGKDTFEIMLEDYISDKQVEEFLLANTREFKMDELTFVHSWFSGKFQKWCRVVSGEIKYNWIYCAYSVKEANKDYLRVILSE